MFVMVGMSGGRRKDQCWTFVIVIEGPKRKGWECPYCSTFFRGGIARVKAHLAQIPNKQIIVCNGDVPEHVRRFCNPQPDGLHSGQAQSSVQPHHQMDHRTAMSAGFGSARVEPTRLAEPSRQPHRESQNQTRQFAPDISTRVEPAIQGQFSVQHHRGSDGAAPVLGASPANEPPSSCGESNDSTFRSLESLHVLSGFVTTATGSITVTSSPARPHEGSPRSQAAGEASTVDPQVIAPQDPAAGDASIIPAGVVNALNISEQEGRITPDRAKLVKAFLNTHPAMYLSVDNPPRHVGNAYNCLAELLMFLDTHSPDDMSEDSLRTEFIDMIKDMRLFKFNDSHWVTSVEKRVSSAFPNEENPEHVFNECCNEEKVIRSAHRNLKSRIDTTQAELDDLRTQQSQYEDSLALIRHRKINAKKKIDNRTRPFSWDP